MIPLQSFQSIWSYGLPIGSPNHYRRRCVYKHIYSILYWILGKHVVHDSPPRCLHTIAGLSTCAELIPIASVFSKRDLKHSANALTKLLSHPHGFTSLGLSKCLYGGVGFSSHPKCTPQQGNKVQPFNLTRSKTANRPSGNGSNGRFFKQDVHSIDNYKEIATCH